MGDAFDAMEVVYAKKITLKFLEIVEQVARYMFKLVKQKQEESTGTTNGFTAEFTAEFLQKAEDYKAKLRACRLDYREAVVVQVLINAGSMGM